MSFKYRVSNWFCVLFTASVLLSMVYFIFIVCVFFLANVVYGRKQKNPVLLINYLKKGNVNFHRPFTKIQFW